MHSPSFQHRFASALLFVAGFIPSVAASAPVKPADSATKIKRVLLYNKVGGWVHVDGLTGVQNVFRQVADAKGFELVELADDGAITLPYLQQFQVIVWNNNTNGLASVPNPEARQAILDYVDQGGGWMLIHGAGDHLDTWGGLDSALGTKMAYHGKIGRGEIVMDTSASVHPELKWMVAEMPPYFELSDQFQTYDNTVRPLPGVTVVATSRAIEGVADVVLPVADGSDDNVYIWAREIGMGRLIFNSVGDGTPLSTVASVFAQQDSIVPKMYWQNLRYAAGDFENGCTDPTSARYAPSARIDDGSCAQQSSGVNRGFESSLGYVQLGRLIVFPEKTRATVRIQLRDIHGAVVWRSTLAPHSAEWVIDAAVPPGFYEIEGLVGSGQSPQRYRLLIPE